ncbi:uncharacterized protein LOC133001254 [Limanda limanda]|uniref:uncharacterized protein LOC133001254 n=1 Tax=Limanda limanda TaxID=27771 RepID=UPI0029C965EA|nr:uncharacterized protein LOC133001254 [Limanda limanda]
MHLILTLLGCVAAADSCLQCDPRVHAKHQQYALSARTFSKQIAVKIIIDQTIEGYIGISRQQKVVIDFLSMNFAGTEYLCLFKNFAETHHAGPFEATQIMEKDKTILKKHLELFIRDDVNDPDVNGPDVSTVLAPSEHRVQAEEGGQAMFDCFLPWHQLLTRKPEFNFTWAPGEPGTAKLNETDFKVLVVTEESFWILNEVEEQGTYSCTVQDPSGTIFYRVTFLLTER